MKRIFLSISILLAVVAAFNMQAQDAPKGKINVFIDYFSRGSGISPVHTEGLRNALMDGITSSNRVNLRDVDAQSALKIEADIRNSDNASFGDDPERLRVMTQEGANLLIQGIVTSLDSREIPSSSGGASSYGATIVYTLKVINPNNGLTVLTKTLKHTSEMGGGIDNPLETKATKEEAIQKQIGKAVKAGKKFAEEAFPIVGRIVEIDRSERNQAKTCYINLGSDNGIAKKQKLTVRLKRIIAGEESLREIGEVEVVDVESKSLSLCKVTRGGTEILDAFKADQELVVLSGK